jgi:hypothetical protein
LYIYTTTTKKTKNSLIFVQLFYFIYLFIFVFVDFFSPGWMTSSVVYAKLRPQWLDQDGNLLFKERLKLPNGNWDAFLEARMSTMNPVMECIYPEIPRIFHDGSDGYTVNKYLQAELFDNLRKSILPLNIDYGDIERLETGRYEKSIRNYITNCISITSLEQLYHYRSTSLCILLPTLTDHSSIWYFFLTEYFGVVSVGGHAGFQKMRGIYKVNKRIQLYFVYLFHVHYLY